VLQYSESASSQAIATIAELLAKLCPDVAGTGNSTRRSRDSLGGNPRLVRKARATLVSAACPQAVFQEHESWLRTVVRSRLSEPEAIEDVMQNIALAIVRQKEKLDDIGRIGAWLYQIAVRQVLMYRRTTGRRRRFQQRLQTEQTPVVAGADECTPFDSLIAMERRESVREALDALNDLDRQILMLKYSEGWTYRQLSEHLGVKEDTVEYRLMKARKNLRRHLRQYAEEGLQSCT